MNACMCCWLLSSSTYDSGWYYWTNSWCWCLMLLRSGVNCFQEANAFLQVRCLCFWRDAFGTFNRKVCLWCDNWWGGRCWSCRLAKTVSSRSSRLGMFWCNFDVRNGKSSCRKGNEGGHRNSVLMYSIGFWKAWFQARKKKMYCFIKKKKKVVWDGISWLVWITKFGEPGFFYYWKTLKIKQRNQNTFGCHRYHGSFLLAAPPLLHHHRPSFSIPPATLIDGEPHTPQDIHGWTVPTHLDIGSVRPW